MERGNKLKVQSDNGNGVETDNDDVEETGSWNVEEGDKDPDEN